MRSGEFDDGSKILRAKIDMASGNINMSDPVMYRIKNEAHQRSGTNGVFIPCTIMPMARATL